MKEIGLIFPHQLFENNILATKYKNIYLVEEWLYFKQYPFHKQKIAFHRATMKHYAHYLASKDCNVVYIDSTDELSDVRKLIPYLQTLGVQTIAYIDTTDDWLEKRIVRACKLAKINIQKFPSPLFINTTDENRLYFSDKKRMFQTDFYIHQRKKRNILVDNQNKPIGGKWTFDDENRLKYPKNKIAPPISPIQANEYYTEAIAYTQNIFPHNYGALNTQFKYPTTFAESKDWLTEFFHFRFSEFGAYEDAIVALESHLHHSVLTPMLNVGLLTPPFIINQALAYATQQHIPLNSVEGFVRQIVGWREFIRAVYELKGQQQRLTNYWGFKKKIPASFWSGTTGIAPVDITIKKILETGYCHHIERLMVLGNFMLLCEFDPNEVYRWFMELFIDAYDWVMVPNVYGMSQFADGGLMSTKPYISASNYLMKMSDYPKGPWQAVWDGLFWRFMHLHRDFFSQNPRLGMLLNTFDKMPEAKRTEHLNNAEQYLQSL